MNEDISKKTIIVLVILTIVISLLGTWTVLNEVSNMRTTEPKNNAQGNVKLIILPNEKTQPQGQANSATGNVAFNIV